MPVRNIPHLQAVTTVGATTTNDTTFSGELFSPIVTSGWTFTNSAKLGDPTFAGAGSGTLDSGIVIGSNTITKSLLATGTFTIVGASNTYTHSTDSAEIFGSNNTGVLAETIVFGHNNSFGTSAQSNTVFGSYNTLGNSTSSNYLFGAHTLGASASSNYLLGTAVIAASTTGNIVIGSAESNFSSCTFIGNFGTGASISTSQFEFWLGTTNDKYIFSGFFPDNGTLNFGTQKDGTIYYDGTNLVLNPDAFGAGKVSINSAYTLPNVDGTANYVLKTDGAGTVSWQADNSGGAATAGGLNTEIQWNNATAIDGTTGLHWLTGTSEFQFDDNIKATFGTGSDATIYYDGTDLIIDTEVVGSGELHLGSAMGGDLRLNKIGLAASAISASYIVNVQTTGTARGAMQFDYTTTGTNPLSNIYIKCTSQRTNNSANYAILSQTIKDEDKQSSYYGMSAQWGTLGTRSITTAGNCIFVGFDAQHSQGVGTANTTGDILQYGLRVVAFSNYTGVNSQTDWGIYSGEDIALASNKKLILEGTQTAKGDTYLSYVTADTELKTYVNATQTTGQRSTKVDFYQPPQRMGMSKGVIVASMNGWGA